MSAPLVTDEDIDKALALLEQGLSLRAIAIELGERFKHNTLLDNLIKRAGDRYTRARDIGIKALGDKFISDYEEEMANPVYDIDGNIDKVWAQLMRQKYANIQWYLSKRDKRYRDKIDAEHTHRIKGIFPEDLRKK